MGCQHTKSASEKQVNGDGQTEEKLTVDEVDDEVDVEPITPRQKELIMETWKHLVDNISNVGVITFMNLFETHPDVQDVFMPFKGLSKEELRLSEELRAHGLRVMGFVQKVVARLEEPEKADNLLRELGKNHVMYGARRAYVDLIGPQFVYAVKPSMTDHWSDEIEESWLQLFRYMAFVMKKAMLESIKTQNSEIPRIES
ncbi:hypothetical protein JTE90_016542 [Oedothorax gibbosus]|uniref:Globin domain-containing protein n=1 Tax=Oedothorax gibbosus TaxID=931172 RepID=A0AAV6U4E7_9ARAC|nr:hypothetical protein JTE90_016542 [Oedothorax gibbosus]